VQRRGPLGGRARRGPRLPRGWRLPCPLPERSGGTGRAEPTRDSCCHLQQERGRGEGRGARRGKSPSRRVAARNGESGGARRVGASGRRREGSERQSRRVRDGRRRRRRRRLRRTRRSAGTLGGRTTGERAKLRAPGNGADNVFWDGALFFLPSFRLFAV
ncbi:MAG: hypothetical protein BJ554DRAFT_8083, partial [Olpidium bornovanus]